MLLSSSCGGNIYRFWSFASSEHKILSPYFWNFIDILKKCSILLIFESLKEMETLSPFQYKSNCSNSIFCYLWAPEWIILSIQNCIWFTRYSGTKRIKTRYQPHPSCTLNITSPYIFKFWKCSSVIRTRTVHIFHFIIVVSCWLWYVSHIAVSRRKNKGWRWVDINWCSLPT